MKRKSLIFFMTFILGLTGMAMAQNETRANFTISSATDWTTFCNNVNNGTTYGTVYLANSISVTTMCGTSESKPFTGTFDGQGNTLTFNKNTSEDRCAPFRYVGDATFQNLKVTGTITTSKQFAGGFVSTVNSDCNCTFTNCVSDITINSSKSGDGTHGGFIAVTNQSSGTMTFNGCVFTGELLGSSTTSSGGFLGWNFKLSWGGTITSNFTNCVFAPKSSITMGTSDCATFARSGDSNTSAILPSPTVTTPQVSAQPRARNFTPLLQARMSPASL